MRLGFAAGGRLPEGRRLETRDAQERSAGPTVWGCADTAERGGIAGPTPTHINTHPPPPPQANGQRNVIQQGNHERGTGGIGKAHDLAGATGGAGRWIFVYTPLLALPSSLHRVTEYECNDTKPTNGRVKRATHTARARETVLSAAARPLSLCSMYPVCMCTRDSMARTCPQMASNSHALPPALPPWLPSSSSPKLL